MNILIDGDGCPVIKLTERIAKIHLLPVIIITDCNHILRSEYSEIITVDQGRDSADFALFSHIQKGDIVITQDYGFASLALSKGAYSLDQNGREYTPDNIDLLLMERHLAMKRRSSKQKKHYKQIPKRTKEADDAFQAKLVSIIKR